MASTSTSPPNARSKLGRSAAPPLPQMRFGRPVLSLPLFGLPGLLLGPKRFGRQSRMLLKQFLLRLLPRRSSLRRMLLRRWFLSR